MRDIIAHLNSKDFYRLRIGISRPLGIKAVADFVLSVPSKEECKLLEIAFNNIKSIINDIVVDDMTIVMNKVNSL